MTDDTRMEFLLYGMEDESGRYTVAALDVDEDGGMNVTVDPRFDRLGVANVLRAITGDKDLPPVASDAMMPRYELSVIERPGVPAWITGVMTLDDKGLTITCSHPRWLTAKARNAACHAMRIIASHVDDRIDLTHAEYM